MNLKVKKVLHPAPTLSFDEWMHLVVKSSFYTDDEAMSRARENLKTHNNGIDKSSRTSLNTRS